MILSRDFPDKAALRRELRRQRATLSPQDRRAAAHRLVRLALRHHLLTCKRRTGFYIPAKNEIDVLPLLDQALRMGVECYLPVVPGRRRKKLWFTRLGDQPAWVLNRYGIPEYDSITGRKCRVYRLETLFMPLLGFDTRGWRIGMGGGYYDASLGGLLRRRFLRKPRLIGVAFSAQRVDRIPNDPWDIPLDGILTECGYTSVRRVLNSGNSDCC
jgi:5-formyltetrahydrofolate cyclo-ligase